MHQRATNEVLIEFHFRSVVKKNMSTFSIMHHDTE